MNSLSRRIYETIKAPLIIQILKLAYAALAARARSALNFSAFSAPTCGLSIKLGTIVSRDDRGITPEFAISDYSVETTKLSARARARDNSAVAVNYGVVRGDKYEISVLRYIPQTSESTIIGKVTRTIYYENYRNLQS